MAKLELSYVTPDELKEVMTNFDNYIQKLANRIATLENKQPQTTPTPNPQTPETPTSEAPKTISKKLAELGIRTPAFIKLDNLAWILTAPEVRPVSEADLRNALSAKSSSIVILDGLKTRLIEGSLGQINHKAIISTGERLALRGQRQTSYAEDFLRKRGMPFPPNGVTMSNSIIHGAVFENFFDSVRAWGGTSILSDAILSPASDEQVDMWRNGGLPDAHTDRWRLAVLDSTFYPHMDGYAPVDETTMQRFAKAILMGSEAGPGVYTNYSLELNGCTFAAGEGRNLFWARIPLTKGKGNAVFMKDVVVEGHKQWSGNGGVTSLMGEESYVYLDNCRYGNRGEISVTAQGGAMGYAEPNCQLMKFTGDFNIKAKERIQAYA